MHAAQYSNPISSSCKERQAILEHDQKKQLNYLFKGHSGDPVQLCNKMGRLRAKHQAQLKEKKVIKNTIYSIYFKIILPAFYTLKKARNTRFYFEVKSSEHHCG